MTDNKEKILELVLRSDEHLTAEEIFHELWNEGQHITLATVYNNLNALCREGAIHCVSFNEKTLHYDKPTRHDHLVCQNCGKVVDVHLKDLTKKLEAESGIRLESYDLKLYYICPDCRKAAEKSADAGAR